MDIGRKVPKSKYRKWMSETYWVEIDGSPVGSKEFGKKLKKSKEVGLEPFSRTKGRKGYKEHISLDEFRRERHKGQSARTNKETGGISQSGIQIYRHWFQFLKLALELEDKGVTTLVTKQGFGTHEVVVVQVQSNINLKTPFP